MRYIFLCLLLMSMTYSFCQSFGSEKKTLYVKGRIIDSVSQQGLSKLIFFVKLYNANSVKSTTDSSGGFTVSLNSEGSDFLLIRIDGYDSIYFNFRSRVKSIVGDTVLLLPIMARQTSRVLQSVTVTGRIPMIRQEADRVIYNVQSDPMNKAELGIDVIRKVPFVSFDDRDQILLKGGNNYKVLVDNRPSSFFTRNLKDALRGIPASQIAEIQIITVPPAKYESEGIDGIINIITLKRKFDGYNAVVNSNYSVLYSGISSSINAKSGDLSLSGGVGNIWDNSPSTSRIVEYTNDAKGFYNTETGSKEYQGRNTYLNTNLTYEADSLNLISVNFSGNQTKGTNSLVTNSVTYSSVAQDQQFSRDFKRVSQLTNIDVSSNFQRGFKRNKNSFLILSVRWIDLPENQNAENYYYGKVQFTGKDFSQTNNVTFREVSSQIDFSTQRKQHSFETGAKWINRKSTSFFDYHLLDGSGGVSNRFSLDQSIASAYFSLTMKYKNKLTVKMGMRAENTINQFSSNSQFTYLHLIPSVSSQVNFKKFNSIGLSFSQRVQRPGVSFLNPFYDNTDPRLSTKGNPFLVPVLNNILELTYSNYKKGFINLTLGYNFSNNGVQSVLIQQSDSVLINTYENIGKKRILSLNSSVSYPLLPKLNLSVNGSVSFISLIGRVNASEISNSGYQGFIYSSIAYRWPKNLRTSFNCGYYGPTVILQGQTNSYFYTNFSIAKAIKNINFNVAIANPFQQYRSVNSQSSGDLFEYNVRSQTYFRNINIAVYYQFGKLSVQQKRVRKGISNEDKVTNTGSVAN